MFRGVPEILQRHRRASRTLASGEVTPVDVVQLQELLDEMRAHVRSQAGHGDTHARALNLLERLSFIEQGDGWALRLTDSSNVPSDEKWSPEQARAKNHLNCTLLNNFQFGGTRWKLEKDRYHNRFHLIKDPPKSGIPKELLVVLDPVAYEWHRDFVARHVPRPKEVVFIQHSGYSILPWIRELLLLGTHVEWYAQSPGAAVNADQKGIVSGFLGHKSWFKESRGEENLQVYTSPAPFSVRGVKVDDRIVSVGWYTYHQVADQVTPESGIDIQGHERPSVVAYQGTPGFEELSLMFDRVLESLKKYRGASVMPYPAP
jgi:hypothetical protein